MWLMLLLTLVNDCKSCPQTNDDSGIYPKQTSCAAFLSHRNWTGLEVPLCLLNLFICLFIGMHHDQDTTEPTKPMIFAEIIIQHHYPSIYGSILCDRSRGLNLVGLLPRVEAHPDLGGVQSSLGPTILHKISRLLTWQWIQKRCVTTDGFIGH